mgnify:CR=1 FL=1
MFKPIDSLCSCNFASAALRLRVTPTTRNKLKQIGSHNCCVYFTFSNDTDLYADSQVERVESFNGG